MRESDFTGNVMRMNRIRQNLHRHAGPITATQRSSGTLRARLSRQTGKLGVVEAGAHADLIALDGDPTKDLNLFQDQGAHIPLIMKAGKVYRNRL